MGLDPPTLLTLSPLLHRLAEANAPRLVLSLRPQDPIPDWITHLIYLKGNCEIAFQGRKETVLEELREHVKSIQEGKEAPDFHLPLNSMNEIGRQLTKDGIIDLLPASNSRPSARPSEPSQNTPSGKSMLEILLEQGPQDHFIKRTKR